MSWKKKALELAITTELSWRKIAKKLDKPKSTVSDFLREAIKQDRIYELNKEPKILHFDIETSPLIVYSWNLWPKAIPVGNIIKDWEVLCWSAKWQGNPAILNSSDCASEMYIVASLWTLLDGADVVVAYNGKSFDKKKMNAKFLEYGFPEPSPYKLVDPYLIVKGNFALTSKKMDFVVKYINDVEEGKHSTDFQLWVDCMNGVKGAQEYMQKYCDQDVLVH